MRQYILGFFFVSGISFCCLTTINPTQAQQTQIVPDATLPNNSSVKLEGNTRIIEGGTRAGGNLFHSFMEFSVPTGSTAFFNNATDIQNIISRVTGGSVSNIDGLIRANGAANLFLINPNGIIFGPNASLNIGGSFLASTASAVKFADGTEFSAKFPQMTPLLTISVPIGLQFGGNAGSIRSQSQVTNNNAQPVGLEVQPGNTLALVSGDVSLDGGQLNAWGGRVELGGVAGQGTVGLNVDGNNLRLSFPDSVARADVSLTNGAVVDVTADGGGGSIAANARNLEISGGSSLKAGVNSVGTQAGDITLDATDRMTIANSSIFNDVGDEFSQAVGNTGTINIKAGSLSLTNADLRASTFGKGNVGGIFVQANDSVSIANSFISSTVEIAAEGNAGGVHIKAGSLSLTDGTTLSASTFGQGNAKGVFVQANNSVDIANSFFIAKAEEIGTGNGGDINIQAEAVSLTDGTFLESSTDTEGRAGNVMIDARNTVYVDNSFISNDAFGSGNGGVINIKARVLSLSKGAELLSRTLGEGKGGNIQINASDVTISGVNPAQGNLISGLIASSEGKATGQGGDISVTTSSLRVSDGAVVSARSRSAGNGGNITVNTNTLELTGGGQLLTSAFSSGSAGNITVNATDRVSISGSNPTFNARLDRYGVQLIDNDSPNSGLFARVTGNATANAGNIEVTTRSIRLDNQGTITTETKSGEGGNITLKARDIVLRNNSNITASAGTAQAGGNGGNIKIDTDVLVSAKNSDITANAFEGKGGNIRINTQGLFLSSDSLITASSERGLDGVVEINTPDVDPTTGLVNLPEAPPADTRLAQGCQPGGSQHRNQFIITGRGGLPPSPFEMLTPDAVQVDLVTLKPEGENRKNANFTSTTTSTTTATPEPIVEASGWVVNAKGEVVLIAHAPTVTPHSSWHSTKCGVK